MHGAENTWCRFAMMAIATLVNWSYAAKRPVPMPLTNFPTWPGIWEGGVLCGAITRLPAYDGQE